MSPLIAACFTGHLQIVKLLIEHNADINSVASGTTALYAACISGHVEAVKLLLEHHADPNKPLKETPLYAMCNISLTGPPIIESDQLEICKLLIQRNANVNLGKLSMESGEPESPVYVAFDSGERKLLKLLLRAGADIPDKIFITPRRDEFFGELSEVIAVRDPTWE